MKRLSLFLGIVIVTVFLTVPAFAWHMHQNHNGQSGICQRTNFPVSCKTFNLNLSEEQSARMQSLRDAHMKEMIPLKNEFFKKRTSLRLLWSETTPDETKIKAMQKEVSSLQNKMEDQKTSFRLAMRTILTPDQIAQLQLARNTQNKGHHGGGTAYPFRTNSQPLKYFRY